MTRGPYRRRPRLKVKELQWEPGDIVTVDGVRWIIDALHTPRPGDAELVSSNVTNHTVRWKTRLTVLPPKASTR